MTDAKIISLANELVSAIQESGRSIAYPEVHKGYGALDVRVKNIGTENAGLQVESICNSWIIEGKPDIQILVPRKDKAPENV
jgi:hypothetical protein